MISEILGGIAGVFLGDATSFGKTSTKITIAVLCLIGGIALLIRPFFDQDGTRIQKGSIPYVIGSLCILISVILVISWLLRRKT